MSRPGEMRKHVLRVAASDPGAVAEFLAQRLILPPDEALRWLARGTIHVEGRRATGSTILRPGDRVIARAPDDRAEGRAAAPPEIAIVHRDAQILVAAKPAGLAAQASDGEGARTLERLIGALHPGAVPLHRLDRDASGLSLFALDRGALPALQRALADGGVERRYVAVAAGTLDGPREIRLRIARDRKDARRRIALPEAASGGQAALTRVAIVGRWQGEAGTVLSLELGSGRTHQIRVHLAAIGHALVGDSLYGGPPYPRLLLHATALALRHPGTGRRIELHCPAPPEFNSAEDRSRSG